MCDHTEIEVSRRCFRIQSQYTGTGLTSCSVDPILPGMWHDNHYNASCSSRWYYLALCQTRASLADNGRFAIWSAEWFLTTRIILFFIACLFVCCYYWCHSEIWARIAVNGWLSDKAKHNKTNHTHTKPKKQTNQKYSAYQSQLQATWRRDLH